MPHAHRQTSLGPAFHRARGFGWNCRKEPSSLSSGSKLSRPGVGVAVPWDHGPGLSCFLTFLSPGENYRSILWEIPRGFLVWSAWVTPVGESRAQPRPPAAPPPQDRGHCRSRSTGAAPQGEASRGAVPRAELPVARARFPEPVASVHAAAQCTRSGQCSREQVGDLMF